MIFNHSAIASFYLNFIKINGKDLNRMNHILFKPFIFSSSLCLNCTVYF